MCKSYIGIIGTLLGTILGFVLSVLTNMLMNRFNWRNFLTKEFTVKIRENLRKETGDGRITELELIYDINCTVSDEFSINYIYIKLPDNVEGNLPHNPTMGQAVFGGNKGKYYLLNKSKSFRHFLSDKHKIEQESVLAAISKEGINKLRIIVNASRYGDVKSSQLVTTSSIIMKQRS